MPPLMEILVPAVEEENPPVSTAVSFPALQRRSSPAKNPNCPAVTPHTLTLICEGLGKLTWRWSREQGNGELDVPKRIHYSKLVGNIWFTCRSVAVKLGRADLAKYSMASESSNDLRSSRPTWPFKMSESYHATRLAI